MSWINAGEVFYALYRREGPDLAEAVIGSLRLSLMLDDASPARVMEAASIKARYPMSYADAFLCATAIAHDATILTGDEEILNASGEWRSEDVRVGS